VKQSQGTRCFPRVGGEQQSVATAQAARGWARPPFRHFKIQSFCCLGSAFEVAFQPQNPISLMDAAHVWGAVCRGPRQPRHPVRGPGDGPADWRWYVPHAADQPPCQWVAHDVRATRVRAPVRAAMGWHGAGDGASANPNLGFEWAGMGLPIHCRQRHWLKLTGWLS
jgi:hypothetical protein